MLSMDPKCSTWDLFTLQTGTRCLQAGFFGNDPTCCEWKVRERASLKEIQRRSTAGDADNSSRFEFKNGIFQFVICIDCAHIVRFAQICVKSLPNQPRLKLYRI